MTDIFERAQKLEQRQRDEAWERHKAEAAIRKGPGLSHCKDCGDEIPELRRLRADGCTRCFSCQSDFERMNKR